MLKKMIALCIALCFIAFPAFSAQDKVSAVDQNAVPYARGTGCDNGGRVLISQTPNQTNGIFADADCDFCGAGVQSVADDFVLANATTIGEIRIWSGYFPNNVPLATDNWTVVFHSDAAGLPGGTLSTESNVPSTRTTTGVVLFGVDEYENVLTLSSPVALAAGTYWVEIYNDSTGSAESVFWEVGDPDVVNGIDGTAFAFEAPGVTWAGTPQQDFALVMCDVPDTVSVIEVPTLSEISMIGLALLLLSVGLIAIRNR